MLPTCHPAAGQLISENAGCSLKKENTDLSTPNTIRYHIQDCTTAKHSSEAEEWTYQSEQTGIGRVQYRRMVGDKACLLQNLSQTQHDALATHLGLPCKLFNAEATRLLLFSLGLQGVQGRGSASREDKYPYSVQPITAAAAAFMTVQRNHIQQ